MSGSDFDSFNGAIGVNRLEVDLDGYFGLMAHFPSLLEY
jgi:hypothetical protein